MDPGTKNPSTICEHHRRHARMHLRLSGKTMSRLKTGPVLIVGEEWPGMYLVGQEALALAGNMRALQMVVGPRLGGFLIRAAEMLEQCEKGKAEPVKLVEADAPNR